MSNRFRNAVITAWEEPSEESIKKCSYFVGQKEKCPSTGKIHYQCYIEFENGKSLKSIKKLFGEKCHIEKRKGTQSQAIAYCQKNESRVEEEPWQVEKGEKGTQGHRNDLDSMLDMIKENKRTWEIIDHHGGNGLRHVNHIVRCQKIFYGIDEEVKKIDDAINVRKAVENDDFTFLQKRFQLSEKEIETLAEKLTRK